MCWFGDAGGGVVFQFVSVTLLVNAVFAPCHLSTPGLCSGFCLACIHRHDSPIKIAQSRGNSDMKLALQVLTMLQAAKSGNWDLLEEMLHTPARYRLNTLIKPFKWGVLHQIAYWGALKELKKLVAQDIAFDFHFQTLDGQTAVQIAKDAGHPKVATELRKLVKKQDQAATAAASAAAPAPAAAAAAASAPAQPTGAAAASAPASASSSGAAAASSSAAAAASSSAGSSDNDCTVCMDAPKDAVFVHGTSAHQACCLECAKKLKQTLKKCPICNLKIDAVAKNFFV
eukprot:m.365949 g.365949  ORF g.365949 m.365949 type:complete len:286 (-) comp19974_c1_seq12:129-986(-)